MFTRKALMRHQQVCNSNNIQKIYKCHLDGDRAPFRSYECYVCKGTLPTFHDLSNHIDKHSVYQQWIDPSNIILSNWRPEDSQEILQNQPLVLVENLKIHQINLASLGGFIDGNSRSNPSKLLEHTIDGKQEYEMESTSTDHAECYPVKVETQPHNNDMVNKADIHSNVINVIDISSESDDDDVAFISETICCD
ncbi:uncharacterized protein LOC119073184 [Bradysia coprophila]|uniref:uncharacterized protein LOC119073184 n=1 Tax=Bradysia coprophila TaxID=38358 RepID=UPI00187DB408|nr:uncharacterized protein LOC119073184 [Bradysia coprophila]